LRSGAASLDPADTRDYPAGTMPEAHLQPCGAAVVLTTVGDSEQARSLARDLVTHRFAACVTSLPGAHSVFAWDGSVQEESEHLLLIKTHPDRLDDLQRYLAERHPYQLPEFLVLPAERGSTAYLQWLHDATRPIEMEEG
jgi:periplasmic divalent cation tolerance protein